MEERLSWQNPANQPSVPAHGKAPTEKYSFEVTARSLGLDEHFIYSF